MTARTRGLRVRWTAWLFALALSLGTAGCGAQDGGDPLGSDDVDAGLGSSDDESVAASSSGAGARARDDDGSAPEREVVVDPPAAFGRLPCDEAPPHLVAAVRDAIDGDVALDPVGVIVAPGDVGGQVVAAAIGGRVGETTVWLVPDGGGPAVPLSPAAAAVTGPDADTTMVFGPFDGDQDVPDSPIGEAIALGQDCIDAVISFGTPPRPEPEPEVRQDLMVVDGLVVPGATFDVAWPAGTDRGIGYVLQRPLGDGSWQDEWWMTSDANGGDPVTVPVSRGLDVIDVGIGGQGPDRLLVDPVTEPGEMRLCTTNARPNVCTPVTVGR